MFKNQFIIFGVFVCSIALTACNDKPQQEEVQKESIEQSVEKDNTDVAIDVTDVAVFAPDSPEAKVDAEQQY